VVPAAVTWVDAWGAAPHSSANEEQPTAFDNQTLRLIVHLHAGGNAVRVRLSNVFADRAVTFGRVRVGLRATGAALVPGSNHSVKFAGSTSVTIAPGAEVQSDSAGLRVAAGQDLAVSLFVSEPTGPPTWHRSALQTNYVTKPGDHTAEGGAQAFTATAGHWFFLNAVSVRPDTPTGAVVALGDSITDGSGSKANANHRWPDLLSGRLQALPADRRESVVNEGIAGNRVLSDSPRHGLSAVHRLNRDVLARRGARHVILLEGINDIRSKPSPPTAEQVIDGYRQIITRVHSKGLKIFGGTLTPFKGSGGYTAALEARRQAVNAWIRTGGEFDGVIDFDRATRDPADPLRFRPAYDSGDHLHPGDAGYRAMADAVDLTLFR